MIDYAKILTELEEERATCQYVYGGMIPAFYTQALHRAIEAVDLQIQLGQLMRDFSFCPVSFVCDVQGRMAKEVSRHDMA